MNEFIQTNWPYVEAYWPYIIAGLVALLVLLWWLVAAMRRTKVETDTSDILDDGKGPANRNQALIDAPPAVEPKVAAPPAAKATSQIPSPAPAPAPSPSAEPESTPAPAPAPEPETVTAADTDSTADDLSRIKGVGPKLKKMLHELGITSFAQIAAWTEADIDRIDSQLGRFEGRIRRDSWTDQAKLLAADDTSGYEEKFGKL